MANIIYIQDAFDGPLTYYGEFLLNEEVQLQINTDMSSFSEDVGQISDLIALATNISTLGGKIGQNMMNTQNLFDAPRWRRTDPLKISMELICFTEGSAKEDVYYKIMSLVNYGIPWKKGFGPTESFTLPGINLNTLKNYQVQSTKAGFENATYDKLKGNSSLISFYIPGIIYLPMALVKSAQPTFSKEITDVGYPLWGKLSLEVWSLTPVTSELLSQTELETFLDGSFKV